MQESMCGLCAEQCKRALIKIRLSTADSSMWQPCRCGRVRGLKGPRLHRFASLAIAYGRAEPTDTIE
jgi:hypothetical protein